MEKIYQSIRETARYTGLSESFLRKGVKDGVIPHITAGVKTLINVRMLVAMYEDQCRKSVVGR